MQPITKKIHAIKALQKTVPRDENYTSVNVIHAIAQGANLLLTGKDVLSGKQLQRVFPYSALQQATIVTVQYQRHEETVTKRQLLFKKEEDADMFLDCLETAEAIH